MKLILVLGGARSGKSNFAKKIILDNYEGPATFLATARPGDEEMRRRISLHKRKARYVEHLGGKSERFD